MSGSTHFIVLRSSRRPLQEHSRALLDHCGVPHRIQTILRLSGSDRQPRAAMTKAAKIPVGILSRISSGETNMPLSGISHPLRTHVNIKATKIQIKMASGNCRSRRCCRASLISEGVALIHIYLARTLAFTLSRASGDRATPCWGAAFPCSCFLSLSVLRYPEQYPNHNRAMEDDCQGCCEHGGKRRGHSCISEDRVGKYGDC